MEQNKELPPAIPIAIEFMRRSFGGTNVEIVSDAYRQEPTEDAPAGALGCNVLIKIPGHDMHPIRFFLSNFIAEDMAFYDMGGVPHFAQMVADEIIFTILKPEYEKLKLLKNL